MIKRLSTNRYFLLILLLFSAMSAFIADSISELETVRTERTEDIPVLTIAEMEESCEAGQRQLKGQLTFSGGDYYIMHAVVYNSGETTALVEMKIGEMERDYDGERFEIPAGESLVIEERFAYGQTTHGDAGTCTIRFSDDAGVSFSTLEMYRGSMVSGATPFTRLVWLFCIGIVIACILLVTARLLITLKSVGLKRLNEKVDACYRSLGAAVKERREYWIVFGIILLALMFLYRKADLLRPLMFSEYTSDIHGTFYQINAIKHGNLNATDIYAGGFYGADWFEYPNFDRLFVAIIRGISFYVGGTYLITNLFYFLCFFINGFSATYVCRKLRLSRISTVLVSVLFALSPYAQQRYQHLSLMLYATLPLAVLVAVRILQGDYDKDPVTGTRRSSLLEAVLFSLLCSQNGIYYTFFACIMYAGAIVIRILQDPKKIRLVMPCLSCILSCIFGIVFSAIPYLLFLSKRDTVTAMEGRSATSSEIYGLRIFRLLLPRPDHRLPFLRILSSYISVDAKPVYRDIFANECVDATLGIIGTIGLIVSLVWLFRETENIKKTLSYLNLLIILTAVSGGIGTLFSVLVTPVIRAYSRMSIVILFISLLCFGMLMDGVAKSWKRGVAVGAGAALIIVGIFDQTTDYEAKGLEHYEELREFLSFIDYVMPEESSIYVLPYIGYIGEPGLDIATVETDHIHFSNMAPRNRGADTWNRHVAGARPDEMREYLENSGYDGLLFDTALLEESISREEMEPLIDSLKEEFGRLPFTTETGRYLYWRIE